MLCVIANPIDLANELPRLDVEQEVRNLRDAVRDLQKKGMQVTLLGCSGLSDSLLGELTKEGFSIETGKSSMNSIISLLSNKHYHFLHFVGHGDYSSYKNQAYLYLEDEDGYQDVVSDEDIIKRLDNLGRALLPETVFFVHL